MQPDPKTILLKVLVIIGYQNDKEKFISEFLSICFKKAFIKCVESMPLNIKNTIKKKIVKVGDNPLKMQEILTEFVPEEKYDEILFAESLNTFIEYLQAVIPTLKENQKKELGIYLKSIAINPQM
jgi:hypothetical protein